MNWEVISCTLKGVALILSYVGVAALVMAGIFLLLWFLITIWEHTIGKTQWLQYELDPAHVIWGLAIAGLTLMLWGGYYAGQEVCAKGFVAVFKGEK